MEGIHFDKNVLQKGNSMPRPNKPKRVRSLPLCDRFLPEKARGAGHEILMTVEEYETLRLIDYQGLTQEECALRMGVGRATVQAMYTEARKKTARFLAEGAALRICGGNYFLEKPEEIGRAKRGADKMKIAVTYENGQVFQHFGHTEQFKIYNAEDGKILSSEIVDTNGSGHGALAGFLQELGVEVLICGGIGGGARNALAEAGIRLYPGAWGDADVQVEAFLKGSLSYDPDTVCSHHHHGEGESCGSHHTEGGNCGHHHGENCGHGTCGH